MATTGVPNALYQDTDDPDLVSGAFAQHAHTFNPVDSYTLNLSGATVTATKCYLNGTPIRVPEVMLSRFEPIEALLPNIENARCAAFCNFPDNSHVAAFSLFFNSGITTQADNTLICVIHFATDTPPLPTDVFDGWRAIHASINAAVGDLETFGEAFFVYNSENGIDLMLSVPLVGDMLATTNMLSLTLF